MEATDDLDAADVVARAAEARDVLPDGLRRVLLHIPQWDDSWQNYYILSQPARVPKGAIVEYIDGRQVIHHDRAYQVMTNSPIFERNAVSVPVIRIANSVTFS